MSITKFGASVVTYKDISDQFLAYKTAEQNHLTALKAGAKGLYDAYVTSLQLSKRTWENPDGGYVSYVQVGACQNGAFEPRQMEIIENEAAAPSIRFIFSLALETNLKSMPLDFVEVQMTMSIIGKAFHLVIDSNGAEAEIPMSEDESRYDAAFASINKAILGNYNLRIFPLG